MTQEERRKQMIKSITGLLERHAFTFEFEVKEKPKGIKIIWEVTQEELDKAMNIAAEKEGV